MRQSRPLPPPCATSVYPRPYPLFCHQSTILPSKDGEMICRRGWAWGEGEIEADHTLYHGNTRDLKRTQFTKEETEAPKVCSASLGRRQALSLALRSLLLSSPAGVQGKVCSLQTAVFHKCLAVCCSSV